MNEHGSATIRPDQQPGARLSTGAIILIGIVSVATAFCGYQATSWGAKAALIGSQISLESAKWNEAQLTANQKKTLDVQLFTQWLNAYSAGDQSGADYYRAVFRDEARTAFDIWLALGPFNNAAAPTSPFVMEEYVVQEELDSARLEQSIAQLTAQLYSAGQKSGDFAVNTVMLASASFFAGLSMRTTRPSIERTLVILSLLSFAWAVYRIAVLVAG